MPRTRARLVVRRSATGAARLFCVESVPNDATRPMAITARGSLAASLAADDQTARVAKAAPPSSTIAAVADAHVRRVTLRAGVDGIATGSDTGGTLSCADDGASVAAAGTATDVSASRRK